jgi:hypothetical protein
VKACVLTTPAPGYSAKSIVFCSDGAGAGEPDDDWFAFCWPEHPAAARSAHASAIKAFFCIAHEAFEEKVAGARKATLCP